MKEKKKSHFWKSNIRGLRTLFRLQPVNMIFYILGSAVYALSWAWQILCMQYFFDTVSQVASGDEKLEKALLWLIILGISYVFSQFMNGAFNCYGQICNLKLTKNLNQLLFNRVKAMELETYENIDELERLNRAMNGSQYLFWVCTTILDLIFYYGIYFAFIGGYMVRQEPLLGLSIVLIFIPCMLSKAANYHIFSKKEDEASSVRRHVQYYEKCLVDREYFKETRLLGAGNFFHKLYKTSLISLGKIEWQAKKIKSLVELVMGTITVACYCIILYMLVIFVLDGRISAAVFAAVLGSLSRLYSNMDEIISERIGWASENVASVDNFLEFVEEPETYTRTRNIENFQKITLKHVDFKYPGTATPALQNINLSLQKGETLAIVGENGCGKSTLCRLIMGLYTPSAGSVLYDEVPSSQIQYMGLSAVFQNYCRYKMEVWENIKISESAKYAMKETIAKLCRYVGFELETGNCPNGLETMLGRDFGGVDLSEGQWQRLALVRGLYRTHNFIVLDEPTASLDPLEETRVYLQFKEMCRDKTAIVVTHRIASAKIANRILVLKGGKIIQEGNFQELDEAEGEFRRMYQEQKKWYVE